MTAYLITSAPAICPYRRQISQLFLSGEAEQGCWRLSRELKYDINWQSGKFSVIAVLLAPSMALMTFAFMLLSSFAVTCRAWESLAGGKLINRFKPQELQRVIDISKFALVCLTSRHEQEQDPSYQANLHLALAELSATLTRFMADPTARVYHNLKVVFDNFNFRKTSQSNFALLLQTILGGLDPWRWNQILLDPENSRIYQNCMTEIKARKVNTEPYYSKFFCCIWSKPRPEYQRLIDQNNDNDDIVQPNYGTVSQV